MGYIEDLAAKEAARRDMEAAKKVEAARVLNQGDVGLAGMATQVPYESGISSEDAYKLALMQQAKDAEYARAQQAMRAAPVENGRVDPAYWDAAQKASSYELERGLASMPRR